MKLAIVQILKVGGGQLGPFFELVRARERFEVLQSHRLDGCLSSLKIRHMRRHYKDVRTVSKDYAADIGVKMRLRQS